MTHLGLKLVGGKALARAQAGKEPAFTALNPGLTILWHLA